MNHFFGPEEGWWLGKAEFMPHTNVAETENGFEVTVELPGMKPEEVTVEMKDGRLWIAGEKKEEKEEKGKTFHRVERRYGEFRRVVPLPVAVDEDRVEAKFTEGVLRINVPKAAQVLPKQVKVSTT
jgi:HSP20 family protein